jgi:hypothetical protein
VEAAIAKPNSKQTARLNRRTINERLYGRVSDVRIVDIDRKAVDVDADVGNAICQGRKVIYNIHWIPGVKY